MDTRIGLQRIVEVFTIVAGFNFLILSRQSIIHRNSDKKEITSEIYGGRKEAD